MDSPDGWHRGLVTSEPPQSAPAIIGASVVDRAAASSVVVRRLRSVFQGSSLCTPLRAQHMAVERAWRRLLDGSAEARRDRVEEAAGLQRIRENSFLVAMVERWFELPSRAWQTAAIARLCREPLQQFQTVEMWQRVRVVGWTLLVAVLTDSAAAFFGSAEPAVLAVPGRAAGAMVAMILMAIPKKVAAAWAADRVSRT